MESIVQQFWKHIDNAAFDRLYEIMHPEAVVWLPNTHEVFKGSRKYVEFNQKYPDRWHARVQNLFRSGQTIISIVLIYNADHSMSFYVTSLFRFSEDRIIEITEYWGDNGEPPQWRLDENFSERYGDSSVG